jgi:phosphatidylethanolamine/phosphatidyl-N-methylethanolamine N-methyltransferase
MRRMLTDYRVFWKEFRSNFRTTGAVLPSGRLLARSLCRFVDAAGPGRRILEVGPGTGAVTSCMVRRLRPEDRLDLVELNAAFVARLEDRFANDRQFASVADRCRVLHQTVESLPKATKYDLIISGLPLNNFSVATVEQLLEALLALLKPGGQLSFFQYIAIRQARWIVSGQEERARLKGITRALQSVLGPHEIRRDWIWPNVPPAWVHHIRVS